MQILLNAIAVHNTNRANTSNASWVPRWNRRGFRSGNGGCLCPASGRPARLRLYRGDGNEAAADGVHRQRRQLQGGRAPINKQGDLVREGDSPVLQRSDPRPDLEQTHAFMLLKRSGKHKIPERKTKKSAQSSAPGSSEGTTLAQYHPPSQWQRRGLLRERGCGPRTILRRGKGRGQASGRKDHRPRWER